MISPVALRLIYQMLTMQARNLLMDLDDAGRGFGPSAATPSSPLPSTRCSPRST
jgi:hypothetical protein